MQGGMPKCMLTFAFIHYPYLVCIQFLSYCCLNKSRNEKKKHEKWHFRYRTLLCLAVFRMAFGHL